MEEWTTDEYHDYLMGKGEGGKEVKAKADPARVGRLTFRSKTEERAWREWVPNQGAALVRYEPVVFHLTGGNYTPDFLLVFENGEMWWMEIKGSFKSHGSGRSSKRSIKQASVEFAYMGYWYVLMPRPRKESGGWKLFTVIDGKIKEVENE